MNLEELDRVLDGARQAPLSESDHDKLKERIACSGGDAGAAAQYGEDQCGGGEAGRLSSRTQPDNNTPPPPGHGRNGAEAFSGARKVDIKHQKLTHGDRCPECGKGNVYGQKEPKVLVRIVGQAPLAATVYSLERLRCGACGQVFTAQEPEGVGPEKYDETAAAMIAQLKYGAGTPFYRLEQLESQLGIPLPAATQWEIVEEAAQLIKPARDELIRQAAQGTVVHNDDTSMRVLRLKRDPSDERTGVFTSGIVSVGQDWKIALYFTGGLHAGENIADVLKQRRAELPSPIQMCDALSRNVPRLSSGVEILLANCLAHGRRQFVEVAENFPNECRYVLEMLGPGVWSRCRSAGTRPDAGRAAAASSGSQRTGDGPTARMAGGAVSRAQDGAELRSGPGDHVSAAALAALDVVPPQSRGPVGQQHRREVTEACGSSSQERLVLPHPERGAGR